MELAVIGIVGGLVIVFGFTYQIVKLGIAHEDRKLSLQAGGGDVARLEQVVAASQGEIERLRQRVEVLERLATDDERRLSREISGLGREKATV